MITESCDFFNIHTKYQNNISFIQQAGLFRFRENSRVIMFSDAYFWGYVSFMNCIPFDLQGVFVMFTQ